jgi:hypothetical protein
MKCPKCRFEQADQHTECIRCGIVFEKYRRFQNSTSNSNILPLKDNKKAVTVENPLKKFLLYVEPAVDPIYFGVRILIFLLFLIWGWKFILTPMESNYTGNSFWHLVNLPFHEAGHIVFRPFGEFITSLGGSLGQLLMPLICFFVFILKSKDPFAASIALWWFGENFMDLAPYINDARELELMLLGGNTGHTSPYGFHDWEYILTESGWLHYDHALAHFAYNLGTVLMLISFIWGGYLLLKQYRNLDLKN